MMSVVNNLIDFMRLKGTTDDEFEEDVFEGNDDFSNDYDPVASFDFDEPEEKEFETQKPVKRYTANKTSSVKARRANMNLGGGLEVCVIKPTSVDDAREITETLLSGSTVILNLEGLDLEVAQRIIDFTSGATFAINGNLQKISNYIFLVTPTNVGISGDLTDLLNSSFETASIKRY
jgi:cell division inhibitor SepF